MAAGDAYIQGVTAVSVSSYFNMQPSAGVEIVIHNIVASQDAQLEFYDGTTNIIVTSTVGRNMWTGMFLHCTNSKYYRIRNVSSTTNNIACDGMVTK